MRAVRKRLILIDGIWLLLLMVALGLLVFRSESDQASVAVLERRLNEKCSALGDYVTYGVPPGKLEQAEKLTAEWHAMTASESSRIAELSKAARNAGVTIVSLRNREDPEPQNEDSVRICSHRLRALGSYSQIGGFLDGISRSRGMASVDGLIIEPGEPGEPGAPGLLRVSLTVSWRSRDPAVERSTGEESAG